MTSIDYSSYENAALEAASSDFCFGGFKQDARYRGILEHVSREQGHQYLDLIQATGILYLEQLRAFCALNDSQGNPHREDYLGGRLVTSPTSLRYVYHAQLILSHCQALGLTAPKFVEIGGGYGGLCAALHHFAPTYGICLEDSMQPYRILDLPGPLALQKKYLKGAGLEEGRCEFLDANTYGEGIQDSGLFLISNYCLSEIDARHRAAYKRVLFPRVAHGFLAWNWIPFESDLLGFEGVVAEPETPLTGPGNLYVRF